MKQLNFSIVIAVYKREEELRELLVSLTEQTDTSFEVLIVDDGSPTPLEAIVSDFNSKLNLHYYYKENSGPAQSRNYGMQKASGNYFIFLDSDTIIPPEYMETVREQLSRRFTDSFGGPDGADASFNDLQKAISFSMTSFLTTGGIRGGSENLGKFQPRSFNMGISKKAFEKTGGFGDLRIGEDPDLSMTLWENGFETQLISAAKVIHKRRTSLGKFKKQVYEFGVARPILNQRHPNHTKLTFWFPSIFMVGLIFSLIFLLLFISGVNSKWLLIPVFLYLIYFFLLIIFSVLETKSIRVGFLSLLTTLIQFFGYGFGFLKSWILVNILKKNPKDAFPTHFSN